jgi:hypothetical protein
MLHIASLGQYVLSNHAINIIRFLGISLTVFK